MTYNELRMKAIYERQEAVSTYIDVSKLFMFVHELPGLSQPAPVTK
jgi:hypothetical protein